MCRLSMLDRPTVAQVFSVKGRVRRALATNMVVEPTKLSAVPLDACGACLHDHGQLGQVGRRDRAGREERERPELHFLGGDGKLTGLDARRGHGGARQKGALDGKRRTSNVWRLRLALGFGLEARDMWISLSSSLKENDATRKPYAQSRQREKEPEESWKRGSVWATRWLSLASGREGVGFLFLFRRKTP